MRITLLQYFFVSVVALQSFATSNSEIPQEDHPPLNVLFIAVDDLGPQIGALGDPVANTPNLDALAREGTFFGRAYSQFPLCNPSRASLLTGKRPDTIGVHDLKTHFRDVNPKIVTLPQHFKNSGYWTGRVGKIFHQGVPVHIGMDGLDDPDSWDVSSNPSGRDKLEEDRMLNLTPERGPGTSIRILASGGDDTEQTDGMVATETIRFLREAKENQRPFFLAAGFYRPHLPFVAPIAYFERHPGANMPNQPDPTRELETVPRDSLWTWPPFWNLSREDRTKTIQAYYACVSFVDAQIGRLMQALKDLDMWDNTVIVLWSDHGFLLGEHGQWCKESLFEQAVRSPLVVRSPLISPTPICMKTVEFIDIFPTTVQLAGLPLPEHLEGRSLVPLMNDFSLEWPYPAFSQTWNHRALGRSIRTDRFRYTEWGIDGVQGVQLYDEEADPGEHRNVAGWEAYADIEARLKAQLGEVLPFRSSAIPDQTANSEGHGE